MMLEQLLSYLRQSQADGWELTEIHKTGWEFYFIRHELDQNRAVDVTEYKVNVYMKSEDGTYLGNASATIHPTATQAEANQTIDQLMERAKLVKNKFYTLNEPVHVQTTKQPSIQIAQVAKDFITTFQEVHETSTEDVNSYEIFVNEIKRHFINSNGIDIEETYPQAMVEVVSNARNEAHEIELYRLYHSGTCNKEGLKADIEKTLQYGKDRLHTIPTPNLHKFDMLFSTGDAVSIYDYFVQRLNGSVVYRKISDWQIGKIIDDQIQGDTITSRAIQYMENSSENHTYDNEGALVHDTLLMKDSVPQKYWANRMFAYYMDLQDTFSLTNYEVEGGKQTEEEIRQGDYLEVVEFSDFQVSAMTGDVFGEIRLGYLHQDGKITPVTGGSVSGNMNEYLKKMYLSKELVQHNNVRIPSVTKLCQVTVTGAK